MGANVLKGWMTGQRPGAVWVDYDAYAARVLASGAADWRRQATRYANCMSQARKAVHTEVLGIDCTAPCLEVAGAADEPLARVLAALGDPAAMGFVTDVIDALAHRHAADTDLVVVVQAPRDLLARCGETDEPSFEALDDVASALAGLVRRLSEKPVAGLLVRRVASTAPSADEKDTCEPLFAAARHYGWLTAVEVAATLVREVAADELTDLVLAGGMAPGELAALNGARRRFGGGLDASYWEAATVPALPRDQLLYGCIPADAAPERVIERSALLR